MEKPDIDLSSCDREPIHLQPGIQNVGFLIAFRPLDLRIQVVSESISLYLGQPFQSVIGQFLSDILPTEWVRRVMGAVDLSPSFQFEVEFSHSNRLLHSLQSLCTESAI